uniref:Uncharacterized protein n=1 Tax=Candidatus Kentrum sp. LFY TaxID=2126342 RepID=A0A450WGZ5_9GAMM|nr:MAG: hypothetical protein BECKLFY1418C_GA0070996_102246 [Candidatus Kentron sp. LFY]
MSNVFDPVVEALATQIQNDAATATPTEKVELAKAWVLLAGRYSAGELEKFRIDKETQIGAAAATKIGEIEAAGAAQVGLMQAEVAEISGLMTPAWPLNPDDTKKSIPKVIDEKLFLPGSVPFLFGILARYQEYLGIGMITSEKGTFYNDNSREQLALLTGFNTDGLSYNAFYRQRSLEFLDGHDGHFIHSEMSWIYAGTSSQYYYPHALSAVLFVKNTTESDLTRNLRCGGATGWNSGYEGAGAHVLTPDVTNDNAADIALLSEENVWNYAGNTSNTGSNSVAITVPAGRTVAIIVYTSPYHYTSPTSAYVLFEHLYIERFKNEFLTTGLEIDIERTVKAHQNPNGSGDILDIWRP